MAHLPDTNDAFEGMVATTDFVHLCNPAHYSTLPDEWVLGVADVVNSTAEIAAGRYKTVNMVGAAVISAQINAAQPLRIPYVFGGDGAGFVVPPQYQHTAEAALRAVRNWADQEFGIKLRIATVTVSQIRHAGHDLRVARLKASDGVDYAMFSGGGLAWAEAEMKAGRFKIPDVDPITPPDLTGLSCRWSNIAAQNGMVLSLVVKPSKTTSEADFAKVAQDVLAVSDRLNRSGHPVPPQGPAFRFPPDGLTLEAHVSRKTRPLWWQSAKLLFSNALIWGLFMSGMRLGNFEPRHYREMTARNADYRKFDDGLKMTIDCDLATRDEIKALLAQARAKGLVHYGLHEQDEAMMTCFVPAATEDSHVHFVDGASGGYASAAAQI